MLLDVRGFVRGRVPWQGRTLEGSGATGARFGMSAVLRGKVVGGAKPWQGRALEGSGASGACFGRPRICVEGSSLLASRGAKPWHGRALERALALAARALDVRGLEGSSLLASRGVVQREARGNDRQARIALGGHRQGQAGLPSFVARGCGKSQLRAAR